MYITLLYRFGDPPLPHLKFCISAAVPYQKSLCFEYGADLTIVEFEPLVCFIRPYETPIMTTVERTTVN